MINFDKTALVLIDLQQGILKMDYAPHTAENVVQNANKLIEAFRKNNGFIAFVRVNFYDGKDALQPNAMISLPPKEGDDYSHFHYLLDKRDDDFVIDKRQFSAFVGTDLDLQLRRRGIDTIMMSAQNETLHQFPIDNVFPLMGQTITTNDLLNILN
ncbi:TPA: isochorismatase family protein [Staphylococcus aureus]|nr:isochorismatase family protein [Staphylococcus aureus]